MIKIEYWNTYDIIDTSYQQGYKNRFWLDVDVNKPNYIIEQEAYENSLGDTNPVFTKWSKQYKFEIYCLEPLADALSALPLHDNVWITLSNGYESKVKDITIDVQWTDIDNVCKCIVSFIALSYIVNGNTELSCEK